jgi:hypothetical protein
MAEIYCGLGARPFDQCLELGTERTCRDDDLPSAFGVAADIDPSTSIYLCTHLYGQEWVRGLTGGNQSAPAKTPDQFEGAGLTDLALDRGRTFGAFGAGLVCASAETGSKPT